MSLMDTIEEEYQEKIDELVAKNERLSQELNGANEMSGGLQAIRERLEAEVKRLKDKKDVVSEICIPNLRPDEAQYVRGEVNRFAKDLLNKLAEQRKHKN